MDRRLFNTVARRRIRLPEPAPLPALTRLAAWPWLVVAVSCLGAFAGQVDASIVQLALPTFEHAFAAPLDAVSWIAVAYVLAFAAALPVYARLAEIAGRKFMYIAGFVLFGLFSVLCGLAPSLGWLIAFRVLQGASGAMLGANSVVVLVAALGAAGRGRALGVMAGAQAVGISAGPALGGVLLGALSWHWIFWVSVPFALVGAALGWLVVPRTAPGTSDARFDWPGAALLGPALVLLLLPIMEAQAWGLGSPATLACLGLAIVMLAGFIGRERRAPAPLIDLGLFSAPAFTGGSIAVVLSYALLYGMFFLMSFALVRGYGDPPLAAGLRLAIVPIALGLVAPFSGGLIDRRPHLVKVGGMALCVASVGWLVLALNGEPGSLLRVMPGLAAYGAGLGLFVAPNNAATLAAAPAGRSGQAGGLLNLMRAFGTGIGVASASSVLAWRLELATGLHERTFAATEAALLGAVREVLPMLAAFAIVAAAACSLHRGRP